MNYLMRGNLYGELLRMGRHRRQIISHHLYEICFRTRSGLPWTVNYYMKLIIESALARVQRDQKVRLCHFVWMGNHPHLLVLAQDSEACTRFYGELQKQLTEALKQLLGYKRLALWEQCSVVLIPDKLTAIKRIAYLYCNPAKADLVDSIEQYPGLSSYSAFKSAQPTLRAVVEKNCPWVRQPMIGKLPSLTMTETQDRSFTERLRKATRSSHPLVIEPNLWLLAFKEEFGGPPHDLHIAIVNSEISEEIAKREDEFREARRKAGKKVLGAQGLKRQGLTLKYTPRKYSRSIFVICSDNKLRMHLIAQYKEFCAECSRVYQAWRRGDYSVAWPPGAFRPAMPPTMNVLVW